MTDDELNLLATKDDTDDGELLVEMVEAAVRRLVAVADTRLGDRYGRREEMREALDVLDHPSRSLRLGVLPVAPLSEVVEELQ